MRYTLLFLFVLLLSITASAGEVWLDELELGYVSQGWGQPEARRSVEKNPLRLSGTR